MTRHIIKCTTAGCPAEELESEIDEPAQLIICAGCGEQITDVTPPVPAPEE